MIRQVQTCHLDRAAGSLHSVRDNSYGGLNVPPRIINLAELQHVSPSQLIRYVLSSFAFSESFDARVFRGVPVVTKDRHARMVAIGEWLSTADYDFVFLEEVWLKSDYALIRKRSEKNYPHGHYFYR